MGRGVAVMEDEGVVDVEFFEEPEDPLGLGVLCCAVSMVGGKRERPRSCVRSCGERWVCCPPLCRVFYSYVQLK